MREVTGAIERHDRTEGSEYAGEGGFLFVACDSYAAACMIDDSIVTEKELLLIDIELAGTHSKGMSVIDWYNLRRGQTTRNCHMALKIEQSRYEDMMRAAFCPGK